MMDSTACLVLAQDAPRNGGSDLVIAASFVPALKYHDAQEHVRGSASLTVCLCLTEQPDQEVHNQASHSPPSSDLQGSCEVQDSAEPDSSSPGSLALDLHPQPTHQRPYLKLEEIVLNLLLTQAQLGSHQLLQSTGHIPGHAHVPTDIEVALLLVKNAEHLLGQLLPQDILNIDLKPEKMVGPGPCCWGEACSQDSWPRGGGDRSQGAEG